MPDEHDLTARQIARNVRRCIEDWHSTPGAGANGVAALESEIAAALRSVKAPPGCILDDTGAVRKVLGTLPVTADGCVVAPDQLAILFNARGQQLDTIGNGMAWGPVTYNPDTNERFRESYAIGKCYSTKEAALRAQADATNTKEAHGAD